MRLLALRPRGLAPAPALRCRHAVATPLRRTPLRSSRVTRCTARVAAAVTTEDGEPAESEAVRTAHAAHEGALRLFSRRAPRAMQILASRIRDAAKTRLTALLQRPQARAGQASQHYGARR
jgi:hypothetical protein